MRKPRDICVDGWSGIAEVEICIDDTASVTIGNSFGVSAKQCRKLAAWLIKAADYLDHKDSRKQVKRT